MPTPQTFARTLDELMAGHFDQREGGHFAPLEPATRTLFGGSLGIAAAAENIPGALFDLSRQAPLLRKMLGAHPFLHGKDPSRTLGRLFGAEPDVEWSGVRGPFAYTGLMTATTLLLADVGMPEAIVDVALRVGFGLDPFNGLLRDRLLGTFGGFRDPLKMGVKIPSRLNTFESILERGCLQGIKSALANVAGAVNAAPRESSTAIINFIRPNRGCAGTTVEISGTGFGATQAADLDLCFTKLGGGLLIATVMPADWSDTRIRVAAPADVGNGPVSFIRRGDLNYAGDTIASATEMLAGEMESCLGMGASRIAFGLRQIATSLGAVKVHATGNNNFSGGPPRVISFTGNNAKQVLLRPRGPLVLQWNTDNADTVEIVASGPRDLPLVAGPLPPSGVARYASVAGTTKWSGSYTLTAKNGCGSASASISVEMAERLALALAGGGSKGAFEVGAVRCLTDVFSFKPDIICGTSVGALNAAKLAEGSATALAELETLWLGMVGPSDLFTPNGWVRQIVQNLGALGIHGIGAVDFASLLGMQIGNYSWLTPEQEIAVGVVKNTLGNVSGGSWAFSLSDVILGAIKAGLHLGKVIDGVKGLLRAPSLFVFTPIRDKINNNIDPAKIGKSGIVLRIAAVNLDDGRTRYVDQRGRYVDDDYPVNLRDAVQASASIPIAFPPTVLPDGNFVDGGIRDNLPLRAAEEAGASSVVAILPSPAAMTAIDFTGAAVTTIAARSFEALFDETLQNDLAPLRGYLMPVTLIAPQMEPYSMLTVDPGLIRINMDYGYMRAYDEMQPDEALRAPLRKLSLDIVLKRLEVWGPIEHHSEGFLMEEEKASFAAVGLQRAASSEYLVATRDAKKELRVLCLQRQTLTRDAAANPKGIERLWQQWETHTWSSTIITPWVASYAHVVAAIPAETPPAALPPP